MDNLNIPIYRAKKINSDEYVEGYLKRCTDTGNILWIQTKDWMDYQIDPSTLSIHFPDMVDSEGTRIFASLSKDGKGGDILRHAGKYIGTAFMKHGRLQVEDYENVDMQYCLEYTGFLKVTGIQE